MRVLEGLGFWVEGVGFRGLRVERFRASWVGGQSRRLLNVFGAWGVLGLGVSWGWGSRGLRGPEGLISASHCPDMCGP